jgi:hypothetical protein
MPLQLPGPACQHGFRRNGAGLDAQLATVREMDGQGVGEIAKVTGLSRQTVYRLT